MLRISTIQPRRGGGRCCLRGLAAIHSADGFVALTGLTQEFGIYPRARRTRLGYDRRPSGVRTWTSGKKASANKRAVLTLEALG